MKRIALLISMYCLVYNTGCKSKDKQKEETAATYTVTSPLKIDTSFTKEYVAQIQSQKNVEIRAQEKGYLESINVDEGQFVHAGQLLFKIMPKMFEADYLKSQALVKEAELEMQNTKILVDKNIVSKTELQLKEAKLDEAKADMVMAQLHLSFTEIKAPFDGTIDRIKFKLGSLIDDGSLLTTLSDNKSIFAYFNVGESEYLNFKARENSNANQPVNLLLANGQQFKYGGVVETVESEFDNETGNIAFRAKFPNPEALLKHGQTGKILMKVQLNNAILIPQKATYEMQDKVYVFVVDKNNVVKSREITIKNKLPEIYVVDGVTDGDKILLDGVQNVKDDDKIEYKYIEPGNVISNLQLIKQ